MTALCASIGIAPLVVALLVGIVIGICISRMLCD